MYHHDCAKIKGRTFENLRSCACNFAIMVLKICRAVGIAGMQGCKVCRGCRAAGTAGLQGLQGCMGGRAAGAAGFFWTAGAARITAAAAAGDCRAGENCWAARLRRLEGCRGCRDCRGWRAAGTARLQGGTAGLQPCMAAGLQALTLHVLQGLPGCRAAGLQRVGGCTAAMVARAAGQHGPAARPAGLQATHTPAKRTAHWSGCRGWC